jgi:hypothetical protein
VNWGSIPSSGHHRSGIEHVVKLSNGHWNSVLAVILLFLFILSQSHSVLSVMKERRGAIRKRGGVDVVTVRTRASSEDTSSIAVEDGVEDATSEVADEAEEEEQLSPEEEEDRRDIEDVLRVCAAKILSIICNLFASSLQKFRQKWLIRGLSFGREFVTCRL